MMNLDRLLFGIFLAAGFARWMLGKIRITDGIPLAASLGSNSIDQQQPTGNQPECNKGNGEYGNVSEDSHGSFWPLPQQNLPQCLHRRICRQLVIRRIQ
jgi:hypothetical protein